MNFINKLTYFLVEPFFIIEQISPKQRLFWLAIRLAATTRSLSCLPTEATPIDIKLQHLLHNPHRIYSACTKTGNGFFHYLYLYNVQCRRKVEKLCSMYVYL